MTISSVYPCNCPRNEVAAISFQDMWLYLSEKENFIDFGGSPVWHETNIPYAVWNPESTRTLSLKYHPSEVLFIREYGANDAFLFQLLTSQL